MINPDYVSKSAIVWGDEKYQFYGHNLRELPMLKHFGIQVRFIMDDLSYCEAQYKIQTRQLYLTELTVYGMHKPYPKIGKTEPEGDPIVHYKELLERLSYYSGSFLMGQPFIAIRQNIFDYLSLRRVNCENGEVKETLNLSDYLRQTAYELDKIDNEYNAEKETRERKKSKHARFFSKRKKAIMDEFWYQVLDIDPRKSS